MFHSAPPSFRARTRSVCSASVSSTTRSTSWLFPDLDDFEELDDSSLMSPLIAGALTQDLETLPLLEPDLCLPLSSFLTILLSRRCLLAFDG